MRQAMRFVLPLVALLALLTWGLWSFVSSSSQRWFQHDLELRGRLAVGSARETLVRHLERGDRTGVGRVLAEMTRDERVMAAGVCSASLELVASTPEYPAVLSCAIVGAELDRARARTPEDLASWSEVRTRPDRGGRIHVAAMPVRDEHADLGFVVLVHDMSFVDRRDAATWTFHVAAFFALAIGASVVTVLVARLTARRWVDEVRRSLRGDGERNEFQPILRDVRDLIWRITAESEIGELGGVWNAEGLRQVMRRHLHGECVVILANREPYIHERGESGEVRVVHPASGLVTALEPVMRACSGVWVAHGSGSADRDVTDRRGRLRVPPGEESYVLRRVWLTPEEEAGYYYGFANEGLWPLCHLAHARPIFRSEDWAAYQVVNQRFSDAVCDEADSEDPIVLVQDYHFALAPRMIRAHLPRATILSFWHIPWPNSEQLGICPWRAELLEGMLGASVLGFHTQFHCNNFLDSVDRVLEARIDREQNAVIFRGHSTLVRPYPISIEWPNHWLETAPPVAECRASVFAELGLAPDARLGVGIDRLDYTKGIEERLLAVERLLERSERWRGRFTFAQLAAPSRTAIERYRQLNRSVEEIAARINQRFGRDGYRPIVLRHAHHEPPTVFRYFRAADVCYVSSLHDGMNLVAKEFVAARDDERGVLVLSHFTGAARELTEALIVNPYDIDQASAALDAALLMPDEEQAERMRSMRRLLAEFNVYRWAGKMLADAARLRQRDRLFDRLAALGDPSGPLP